MIEIKLLRRHVCRLPGRSKRVVFTHKKSEATSSSDNSSSSRLILSELGMIFLLYKIVEKGSLFTLL